MSLGRCIVVNISPEAIEVFRAIAKEKIRVERWAEKGRNPEVKARNWVMSWTSEYAWKKKLDQRKIKHEWASTYVGDAKGAPPNFRVWLNGIDKTIEIRSRMEALLKRYKEVPYPDDRYRLKDWDKILDYIISCSIKNGTVRFYGAIEKQDLISKLGLLPRIYSRNQQEYFRRVSLEHFSYDLMMEILEKADREY